jgi:NAD(P)-dependent dehydrogenase (short-subunit alcohol dehydrogenase family)
VSGYRPAGIPDLAGQTAISTGANSGIGLATAQALAGHGARVVTVSSGVHYAGRIDFDDLNWERRRYRPWPAYGQSKLANLLFTRELQRRLTGAGSAVRATAARPGYAATNLQFHSGSKVTSRAAATPAPAAHRGAGPEPGARVVRTGAGCTRFVSWPFGPR